MALSWISKMGMNKKDIKHSSILTAIAYWLFTFDFAKGDNYKSSITTANGLEVAMIAATKNFSSTHKVRFH